MADEKKAVKGVPKINIALVIIALVAPAGYVIGLSYYQGVLSSYGVNYDSFPIQVHDAYVLAYYAGYHFLFELTDLIAGVFFYLFEENLVWTAIVFLIVVAILYCVMNKPNIKNNRFFNKIVMKLNNYFKYLSWDHNPLIKSIAIAGFFTSWIIAILFILATLSTFWIALPLASYHKGKSISLKEIISFRKDGCVKKKQEIWTNCKSLVSKDDEIIYEGILVAHNKDFVAFLTEKGTFIRRIPKDSVIKNKFAE